MKTSHWLFVWIPILLTGCISKKKHLEEVNHLQEMATTERQELQYRLDMADTLIYNQELKLAERAGAIDALFTTQDRLQARIDLLQEEIERLQTSSEKREQTLDKALQDRVAEIAEKERQLRELGALLDRQNSALQTVLDSARIALMGFDPKDYILSFDQGEVSINLTEKLLFRPGSTTSMQQEGIVVLERISQALSAFPSLKIQVVGHTDNRPVPRRSINDNWEYSVLRAATVVRLLTKDFEISTSRIIAAGKGEFAPRVSNETDEGRAQNRRIELRIRPDEEELARAIRRRLR